MTQKMSQKMSQKLDRNRTHFFGRCDHYKYFIFIVDSAESELGILDLLQVRFLKILIEF